MFSRAEIPTAINMDDFLKGGKNVWSYIGGGTPESPMPDNAPFLFTKNLRLTTEDLHYYGKPENADDPSFAAKLDAAMQPLGDKFVVVVYRDATTGIFKAADLTPAAFFGGCEMPPYAYVIHPK